MTAADGLRAVIEDHGTIVPVFAAREVGRYATRVRVRAGSCYEGRTGVVVTIHHETSVLVRFDSGLALPFSPSELEGGSR